MVVGILERQALGVDLGLIIGKDIAWDALEERVLAAIATQAGGEEDFCLGTDEFRADVLRQVERSRAQDFAALLATVPLYYESPNVLAAFGWPSRPPQPWAMS